MSSILMKGVIRNGRVELNEPVNWPDGTEVLVTSEAIAPDENLPMNPDEIARVLAAMAKVQPFEMTDEEREAADAWEKRVDDYSIANMDKGIEDVFR